jgi:flagellar assembly protein FliH
MPMIRQSDREEIARDAIALHLGDLMARGKSLREEAQRRAQAIIDKAHLERQRILDGATAKGLEAGRAEGLSAGYKDGFEKGHAEAMAQAREDAAAVAAGWESALSGFVATRQELIDQAGTDVLRLVLQIAERVIKRSIAADPVLVMQQVEHVLAMVARPSRLVLRVHPEDRALAAELLPATVAKFSMVKHVELVDDVSLLRGSVVAVDTSSDGATTFDADILGQMERIAAAIVPSEGDTKVPAP